MRGHADASAMPQDTAEGPAATLDVSLGNSTIPVFLPGERVPMVAVLGRIVEKQVPLRLVRVPAQRNPDGGSNVAHLAETNTVPDARLFFGEKALHRIPAERLHNVPKRGSGLQRLSDELSGANALLDGPLQAKPEEPSDVLWALRRVLPVRCLTAGG